MERETFTREQFWSELDALGEDEVRIKFSVTKQFGNAGPKHELAKLWLCDRAKAHRDKRENITLTIAIVAVIIAVIAARADIKWLFSSVISWFSN